MYTAHPFRNLPTAMTMGEVEVDGDSMRLRAPRVYRQLGALMLPEYRPTAARSRVHQVSVP